ncbi:hypothetical protein GCM10023189_37140 [Nibrella saemangeumensis]|uniref:Transglycosylase SLT domain-containing protein n=2 Tax=Nibrella saemangeumensis TaxID=1084526 RepID=A0ABP8N929_9BACT
MILWGTGVATSIGHAQTLNVAASSIHFCGEILPAHQPAIAQRWLKSLTRQAAYSDDLRAMKRRAAVVFPIIEPIIEKYNIPSDFKYIPLIESELIGNAVSSQGAAGFWQLMPQTARTLGLRVNRKHDDRMNLLKATEAACRYIRSLHRILGNWTLVAAAYNSGPNFVRQLRREHPDQHPIELPYKAQTQAYLYQAVAVKELFSRPQVYKKYLKPRALAALSKDTDPITEDERLAILSTIEKAAEEADALDDEAMDTGALSEVDAEAVTLLASISDEPFFLLDEKKPIPASVPVVNVPVEQAPAAGTISTVPRLETRSLSGNALTEGQLFIFEVVRPQSINGVQVGVGDLLYAQVQYLDAASGRAFLRTQKLVKAQNQETINLKLSAVEQVQQPGVRFPTRETLASGWRLSWEQI